jgi:hypothetical protein
MAVDPENSTLALLGNLSPGWTRENDEAIDADKLRAVYTTKAEERIYEMAEGRHQQYLYPIY